MLRALALAAAVALPLPACADDLPAQRPPDLEIRLGFDGGMRPRYYEMTIKGLAGLIQGRHRRKKIDVRFTLSAAAMDRLWQIIRRNRFDQIGVRQEGKVYDRGGYRVSVAWDGRSIRVNDSGRSFVERSWRKQFSAVLEALKQVYQAELKKSGQSLD